ncbi:chemokine-like protein TAFA-5 isoform X1 [Sceloporus undulatus]|uniref:chemokine-like protein TAFA-5 isoform X1 n=1 Tax=Sceloporus undulatus TaxID=8520 RepID=UPI001C4AD531|nr:chemokine-like protein TAFA-5 isoform X1 [Sceloporus undulatus]
MLAGWRELSTGISAVLGCLLFFWLLYSQPTKEGKELEVGTCEITALDRDISHPKRMIARQTARCACRRGQVAGTTKAKPACVDGWAELLRKWEREETCFPVCPAELPDSEGSPFLPAATGGSESPPPVFLGLAKLLARWEREETGFLAWPAETPDLEDCPYP